MILVLLLGGRFYRWCWNPEMKIIAAICIGLAIGASALTSSLQQRGSLVTTLANDVPLEFVRIAPGEFMFRCSAGDTVCADDEKPAHRVRITRGFEMGKYEVTSAQWQAVTVKPPVVLLRGKGDDHAYGFANWTMAQEFVDGLNARKDGYTYRLPTEAEWEYAARAGSTGPYAGRVPDALGWFGQNVVVRPESVGKKQANAWGLYDMHGNAWEWVADWYDAKYYSGGPADDPKGPASGQYRVLRGGSSLSEARFSRSSARHFIGSTTSTDYYGLRVVREAAR
jgi:formylglycine-generating enzyme required for sulfatase activity